MRRAASPVLLALVLLTACGGGGDELSKEDFLAQAEELCADANTALEDAAEPTTPDEIGPYFEKLLGTAKDTTSELEALAADTGDEERLKEIFLTPLRGQVDVLEAYLPKVEDAVDEGEQGLSELEEPQLPEADLDAMRDYGFDDCVTTAEN